MDIWIAMFAPLPQLLCEILCLKFLQFNCFLGPEQGAGGITAAAQVYPKGVTIYGRWTAFQPSAAGVICYFGK